MKIINFSKINPSKGTVVFTWDDNSVSHYQLMAPIFSEFNYKCTFYINPGEENFKEYYETGYKTLLVEDFEIGSHGYTHHHFSLLSSIELEQQLINARNRIYMMFSRYPTTFAFPHHDFNEPMLKKAKGVYLETRNTLCNAKRFSLKTSTNIDSISKAINKSLNEGYTLVFSGHSMINTDISLELNGYEPISADILINTLELLSHNNNIQVLTFEQAALLSFIQQHCEIKGNCVWIQDAQLNYLMTFGLDIERITELL